MPKRGNSMQATGTGDVPSICRYMCEDVCALGIYFVQCCFYQSKSAQPVCRPSPEPTADFQALWSETLRRRDTTTLLCTRQSRPCNPTPSYWIRQARHTHCLKKRKQNTTVNYIKTNNIQHHHIHSNIFRVRVKGMGRRLYVCGCDRSMLGGCEREDVTANTSIKLMYVLTQHARLTKQWEKRLHIIMQRMKCIQFRRNTAVRPTNKLNDEENKIKCRQQINASDY